MTGVTTCRAAVLHGLNQKWSIEEITIDPPKAGEVLVNWKVAGLCHSDEHFITGDMVPPPEMLEAAGLPDRKSTRLNSSH